MKSLQEIIASARKNNTAVGHFNVGNTEQLKAVSLAGKAADLPVIIGLSESERAYFGLRESVAIVQLLRREGFLVYLNADHTKSLDAARLAVEAGYDAVLFDAGKLPLDENIKATKNAVTVLKKIKPSILVEGELGYLGSGSKVFDVLPADAAITPDKLTTVVDAVRFVSETGVDLLAPAVGNIHGMFASSPNPDLDISRIEAIAKNVAVPLVLHGGSGVKDEDFLSAIKAGVAVIHISTELRRAWRNGLEAGLRSEPNEVSPCKIGKSAVSAVYEVALSRLRLFNHK